ncbi:MAG TPA: sulfite exporter TauE/SafE family protein [Solirubrobacteraceae bacterium]
MIGVILIGFAAGMLAGLLGIGGGALFVPALALIVGLSQVDAQATSLLAIVPVALVGAWRQHRYGNVRLGDGMRIGLFAIPAALLGVVVVNAIPERITELLFAALLIYIAWTLARGALQELRGGDGRTLHHDDDDDTTRPA